MTDPRELEPEPPDYDIDDEFDWNLWADARAELDHWGTDADT